MFKKSKRASKVLDILTRVREIRNVYAEYVYKEDFDVLVNAIQNKSRSALFERNKCIVMDGFEIRPYDEKSH